MDIKGILGRCDHTLLKQEATWEQIKEICDDGLNITAPASASPPPMFTGPRSTWATT